MITPPNENRPGGNEAVNKYPVGYPKFNTSGSEALGHTLVDRGVR